jgi:hypothetical protein
MDSDLIIACVRTGTLYGIDYVRKLRNMVARHLKRPYTFVCLTDQPDRCEGVAFLDVSDIGLPGWWAKMILFAPEWRGLAKVVYIDLDTVIINDITPLTIVPGEFSTCENFTRLSGSLTYPCKYNSSVLVIGAGQAAFVWNKFVQRSDLLMSKHARYGDQACMEELYPTAPFLQTLLPRGFLCNYRNLTNVPPKSVIITFGGSHKPHNCPIPWVQREWT